MAQGKSTVKRKSAASPDNLRTTIVMPKRVHELGVALAKSERRSFSNLLTTLIEKAETNGKVAA